MSIAVLGEHDCINILLARLHVLWLRSASNKKVKHFIQNIRVQDSQLDFAINTVKADREF